MIALLPSGLRELFERQRIAFVEHAIDPDLWRNVGAEDEPPRHFLDLDAYGAPPFDALPRAYDEAVTRSALKRSTGKARCRGGPPRCTVDCGARSSSWPDLIAPGYAIDNVVFFASVLSHYVGDAHVPFHAIVNYDGQVTGQLGIHSRFESDLFSRLKPSLKVAPRPIAPVTDARAAAFASLIESAALTTRVLEADRQAIGSGNLYDAAYFTRFAEGGAGPILEQRINEAIASVAAHIVGAWEAAGKPDLLEAPAAPTAAAQARVATIGAIAAV